MVFSQESNKIGSKAVFCVLDSIYLKSKKMSSLRKFRAQIRQIIAEMTLINEAQKTPEVDSFIKGYFSKVNFFVAGTQVTDPKTIFELAEECSSELRSQINSAQSSDFNYEDFYILKFSDFIAKTTEGNKRITFEDPEMSTKSIFRDVATSFIVYVYHNTLFRIMPYNEAMQTDAKLEAEAKRLTESAEFQNLFSLPKQKAKFTGEIKTLWFEKKIRIYSQQLNPPTEKEQPAEKDRMPHATEKKAYRPNTPLIHKIFGKGNIISSEKRKDESGESYFIVQVDFPKVGIKRIKMNAAA